jgi:NAD(P)-dependent dehydrogenase (short-subunit alcohol dehydrogenase family)
MMKRAMISGVSGLLGRALVEAATGRGLGVTGQYHRRRPRSRRHCIWLHGDFTTPESTASFLEDHGAELSRCHFFIHGYGPITHKDTAEVTAADFRRDFSQNLESAVALSRFFIARAVIESVIYLGFESCGRDRAYRDVLTYAVAKNGLLLLTRSYARRFPDIRFNMVSPPTLTGARISRKGVTALSPEAAADTVLEVLLSPGSGRHHILRKGGVETTDGF